MEISNPTKKDMHLFSSRGSQSSHRATMTVFLFPGQGSQRKGMGNTLFDEFKEVTARADEILGYSVKELCLHDTHQQLGQTQFTQPALYTVNALICASDKFMPLL